MESIGVDFIGIAYNRPILDFSGYPLEEIYAI